MGCAPNRTISGPVYIGCTEKMCQEPDKGHGDILGQHIVTKDQGLEMLEAIIQSENPHGVDCLTALGQILRENLPQNEASADQERLQRAAEWNEHMARAKQEPDNPVYKNGQVGGMNAHDYIVGISEQAREILHGYEIQLVTN